jgi:hypothetical protein
MVVFIIHGYDIIVEEEHLNEEDPLAQLLRHSWYERPKEG